MEVLVKQDKLSFLKPPENFHELIVEKTPSLPYQLFRGFRIPKGASKEYFQSAADHIPGSGDIFIVSYPKCGTTWMQHIVYLLLQGGRPADSIASVVSAIPFVEQDGWPEGGPFLAFKYHLPLKLMPFSESAKYIYVARNPKDACVSCFHFLKNLPGYHINSFNFFYDAFMSGELPYGDFAEHVVDWMSAQQMPNVLFVTYESLSRERERIISRVAEFLGVRLEERTLQDIVRYSSFDFMRHLAEKDDFMRSYLRASTGTQRDRDEKKEPMMMRRGVAGDWRNYFSAEQNCKMNDYLRSRTRGTDLMKMWEDHMDL